MLTTAGFSQMKISRPESTGYFASGPRSSIRSERCTGSTPFRALRSTRASGVSSLKLRLNTSAGVLSSSHITPSPAQAARRPSIAVPDDAFARALMRFKAITKSQRIDPLKDTGMAGSVFD